MKIDWKIAIFKKRDVLVILIGLYIVNYLVTPNLVGEARLESFFRPQFNQKFDSAVWKKIGLISDGKLGKWSSTYGSRYKMVDDVLKNQISVGMKAQQVEDILGKPDGGIIDRTFIEALGNAYGSNDSGPGKEILESPDEVAYWAYHLASQSQYPAKSIWFPNIFLNFDEWELIVKMKNNLVADIQVSF